MRKKILSGNTTCRQLGQLVLLMKRGQKPMKQPMKQTIKFSFKN